MTDWLTRPSGQRTPRTPRHSPHHGQDVLGLDAAQPPVDPLPAGVAPGAAAGDVHGDDDVAELAGEVAVPAHAPPLAHRLAAGAGRPGGGRVRGDSGLGMSTFKTFSILKNLSEASWKRKIKN